MASLVPGLSLGTCILLRLPQGQELGTANSLSSGTAVHVALVGAGVWVHS